ncbi:MAG: WecB/TagA/CpsF family glycosyltransferase, partial [Clostridia bacterium]|nr:WecB/TagA/CpsF family glycosyltransferase [Clostridia bacterium]
MKTNIMGVMFDSYTIQETVQKATSYEKTPFVIVTPNPEIVQVAKKDKEFMDVLNSADIVTPDGIGIVYASKILGGHIKQRAAGFDICCGILDVLAKMKGTVYLFGGKPGVAEIASKNIEQKYKGVSVVGFSD